MRRRRVKYSAEDEEPNCGNCDYCCDGFDCDNYCGPSKGWYGYCRTEIEEYEEE